MRYFPINNDNRVTLPCQGNSKSGETYFSGLRLSLLIICLLAVKVGAAEPVLNIFNWADYIGETTIDDFENEFGIEVNYDVYDTSEIVDAKMMAGRSGYDLVVHSAAFSSRLMLAGIYSKLKWERLKNRANLDPTLLKSFSRFDPGNRHGMPYMWGTTGFKPDRV